MRDVQRQSLVGRDRELDQLTAYAADARAGRGTLCLVTGEPGIGKTRLAEALTDVAESEGMVAVWGRCWENPGAPAFWPWAQALRALIERRDETGLTLELGSGGDWIAEIVPELRDRVVGIEPLGSLRSEQARFALFDAVGTFLRNVSATSPLVVVLDDLHAADRESLAMLEFVTQSLSEGCVLLLGAYQDAVARARPEAQQQFAALTLSGRHVALSGIGEESVGRILEGQLGAPPPGELVRALHTTTEGNPLFAGEVMRLLLAEGQLQIWEREDAGRLPLPDTVGETIRRRFDPLGPEAFEMLKVAAVIGREFRHATVAQAMQRQDGSLNELLDRARAAGIVTESPGAIGRFRFTHGLFREVLYAKLTTAEHVELHLAVGEALELVHGDDPEHLAELAHHFAEAAPGGNVDRALDYAERAGREAMRVRAYERAGQLFELALDISEQRAFDSVRHADLLLALGLARTRAGDPAARDTLLAAADAQRPTSRPEALAQAALGIHVFNLSPGVPDDVSIALLEEALERIGPEDSELRARLLARIATALYYRFGTQERRDALVTEAVAMARRLDDHATLAYVLINGQLAAWGPDTTERDLDWVEELLVLTEAAGNAELALATRTRQIDYLLELDDLVGADIALLALERIAADSPDPRARAYVPLQRARRAAIEGRYSEAEDWNKEATEVGAALNDRMVQLLTTAQLTMLRWTQGRLGEVEEVIRRFADAAPGIVGWRAALARTYCELGREAEARRELERLDQRGFAQLPRYNGWLNMMALLAEVCAQLGEVERAAALYRLLLPFERRNVVTAQCVFDGPVSRYLGIMATTIGDWDCAEAHFEAARGVSLRQNARPFVALIGIDEATMMLARDNEGDRARARALLAEACDIVRELGMDKIAERAEGLLGGLGDFAEAPAVDGAARAAGHVGGTDGWLCREGDVWALSLGDSGIHIRDGKGVRYLAVLLASPGVEIHALELAGGRPDPGSARQAHHDSGLVVGADDAGSPLDTQAKVAYRRRLEDLRAELSEAESFNDTERIARAREEMEFLAGELAGAVGLGGRDRKAASNAERARVAVTKAVRATLKRIGEMDPEVGAELATTIRTGTFCCYEPDRRRPVTWQVDGA